MKKIIYYSFFIVSILVSSCAKNDFEESLSEDQKSSQYYTLKAETETAATKVSISKTGETYSRLWESDDSFLLFDGSGVKKKFTLSSGQGTKSATFISTSEPATSSIYYAVSPYSSDYSISDGVITLSYPSQVEYNSSTSITGEEFLVAKSPGVSSLSFKTLNSYISLSLSSSSGYILKNLKIMGNDDEIIAGDADVTFNQDGTPSVTMHSDGTTILTVSFPDGLTLSSTPTVIMIAIPPVLTNGFRVILNDSSCHTMGIKSSSSTSRNSITVMPDLQYTPVGNIVYGTSNCYLVSNSETSVDIDLTPYAYGSDCIADYSSAKVAVLPHSASVLSSVNTLALGDMSFDSERCTLTVPITGEKGNAVVAIMDSDGNILWSYHIWKPADDVSTPLVYSNGYKFMPLPLGALSIPTSALSSQDICGLFYQWGRKDPFPKDYVNNIIDSESESWAAVQQSVKTPNKYLRSTTSNHWMIELNNNLWCNSDVTKKSVFDPSPKGYRVPPIEAYNDFTENDWISNKSLGVHGYNYTYSGTLIDIYPAECYYSIKSSQISTISPAGGYWASTPSDRMVLQSGHVPMFNGIKVSQNGFYIKCIKME